MADRIQGKASAVLPTRVAQDTIYDVRVSPYGDVMSQPVGKSRATLAEEGSYYIAVNATPGTGVAGIAAANGYDATEALCTILNAASSSKTIVLDYIKLSVTAAGTNGTDLRWDAHLDTGSRYTSGGSVITAANAKVGGAASQGTIQFGAVVAPAATADVLRIGGNELRSVIKVIGDQYTFDFGGDPVQGSGAPANGTLAANLATQCAPVILAPGKSFILTLNSASQSVAASYEFEIGYWER